MKNIYKRIYQYFSKYICIITFFRHTFKVDYKIFRSILIKMSKYKYIKAIKVVITAIGEPWTKMLRIGNINKKVKNQL